jgi:hypothetical protein
MVFPFPVRPEARSFGFVRDPSLSDLEPTDPLDPVMAGSVEIPTIHVYKRTDELAPTRTEPRFDNSSKGLALESWLIPARDSGGNPIVALALVVRVSLGSTHSFFSRVCGLFSRSRIADDNMRDYN